MAKEATYCAPVRHKYIDHNGDVVVVPACGPDKYKEPKPEEPPAQAPQPEQTEPTPPAVVPTTTPAPEVPPTKPPRPRDECWDDETSGDCTFRDAEIINDKQRSLVTRVDEVDGAQDETAKVSVGVLDQYMGFWRGVAQGDETAAAVLAVGMPFVVGLIATVLMFARRK